MIRLIKGLTLFSLLCASAAIAKDAQGLLTAKGFGTVDLQKVPIKSQARIMARRAAMVDAQRNLSEQVRGVRLTGGTTMQEYEVSSDIVATRVKGLLSGAFELDAKVTEDPQSILVEVTMALCVDNNHPKCASRPTLRALQHTLENP